MSWLRFFAARDDLLKVLDFALTQPGLEILESQSEPGRELRRFDRAALAEHPLVGADPHGDGFALQLLLWAPEVCPEPAAVRVELRRSGAEPSFRYVTGGAGLFVLQCGGRHEGLITASKLGWFTEAAARAKYAGVSDASSVDWTAHRRLASRFRYHVTTRLGAARVQGRAVLPEALRLHRSGVLLRDTARAPETFAVA